MDEKNHQMAHRRMVASRRIPRNYGRNNNSPATGLFCAVQMAITPWLFSARATPQNPSGRPAQRAAAVTVLASLMALLFFGYIGGLWPRDEGTREFAFIGLGLIALLVIFLVARLPPRSN
jgi:hypothetical protein